MKTALDVFRMPTPVNVMGRSSSITNSFINGIIPARFPSERDVAEALAVLEVTADDLCCAYCGDKATEWDHFRPLIERQEPKGYISEIQNLVPACGKCNQSKGNSHWRDWMLGNAKKCPRVRGIQDLDLRVARLERFETWREPTKLDIPELVGEELWNAYRANWRELLDAMRKSQELASEIKAKLRELHVPPVPRKNNAKRVSAPAQTSESKDEVAVVTERLRNWAGKPQLNVHKIVAIVVQARGGISRHQLIKEAERVTKSKNAYGAIASLLTTKGNAYGRVFEDRDGLICIHPTIESAVRSLKWVSR